MMMMMMTNKSHAFNTVIASLIIIAIVIVIMIYVPRYIGLKFEARRKASKKKVRRWLPSQEPMEQQQREQDIEIENWPLQCPEPVFMRSRQQQQQQQQQQPDDWPLRRPEPLVMSERRQRESFEDIDLGYDDTAGCNLEGFPYIVR
ncbi:hypothetical protein SBOR_4764 [Sclerotinia borealis F-4128]|uniref:Uncharacterized protein n=1 Tax=Sclerotinia borealis (strain F-4128) TaxID=1432307 RepID=W9CG43_SCLBF|nr:hypothetical protein SBOR_4764 [Sclerotinia borealis F-4128]